MEGKEKVYSWHAPEVECIGKGKARTPYDGHTLAEALEQSSVLLQGAGVAPKAVYADLGYRGVDAEILEYELKHRGKFKRLPPQGAAAIETASSD